MFLSGWVFVYACDPEVNAQTERVWWAFDLHYFCEAHVTMQNVKLYSFSEERRRFIVLGGAVIFCHVVHFHAI